MSYFIKIWDGEVKFLLKVCYLTEQLDSVSNFLLLAKLLLLVFIKIFLHCVQSFSNDADVIGYL